MSNLDPEVKFSVALKSLDESISTIKDYPESVLFRMRARRHARFTFNKYLTRKSVNYKSNRAEFFKWIKPQFNSVIDLVKFIG